jgi:hypothetical protein
MYSCVSPGNDNLWPITARFHPMTSTPDVALYPVFACIYKQFMNCLKYVTECILNAAQSQILTLNTTVLTYSF